MLNRITYVAMDNRRRSYHRFPDEIEVNKNLEGQVFKEAKFDDEGYLKEIIFKDGTILTIRSDLPDIPVIVDSLFRSSDV